LYLMAGFGEAWAEPAAAHTPWPGHVHVHGARGRAGSAPRPQDDPAVRAELAAVLKELGRHEEARVEAEKVLRQDPQNETARMVVGR
jgi:hypothetical protein